MCRMTGPELCWGCAGDTCLRFPCSGRPVLRCDSTDGGPRAGHMSTGQRGVCGCMDVGVTGLMGVAGGP